MTGTCSVETCERERYSRGWCRPHYNRWRKRGDVQADVPVLEYRTRVDHKTPKPCVVDGCERTSRIKTWCNLHYKRWLLHGDVRGDMPSRGFAVCVVEGCDRKCKEYKLCAAHRSQARSGRAIAGMKPIGTTYGAGSLDAKGYRVVYHSGHPNAGKSGQMKEHIFVMSEHLGRALRPGETVHHRNGIRDDNRIENLELWTSHHSSGQRVEDLYAWATEIIATYGDEIEQLRLPAA